MSGPLCVPSDLSLGPGGHEYASPRDSNFRMDCAVRVPGRATSGSTPPAEGHDDRNPSVFRRTNSLRESKVLMVTAARRCGSSSSSSSSSRPLSFRYHEHFDFLGVVGRTDASEVFRVRHRATGEPFAVKRSRRGFRSKAQRERCLREVRAVASLPPHPNLVSLHRAWQEGGHFYIQMDLCEGGSLAEALRQVHDGLGMRLGEGDLWQAALDVSAGLAFLHASNVLHLDIKPENVCRDAAGVWRIGDFGLAVANESADWEEGDGEYVAPELLRGEDPTPAADVFSLGVTLFECAAGGERLPRSGRDGRGRGRADIARKELEGRDPIFVDLVARALDEDPKRRPSSRDAALLLALHARGRAQLRAPLPPQTRSAAAPAAAGARGEGGGQKQKGTDGREDANAVALFSTRATEPGAAAAALGTGAAATAAAAAALGTGAAATAAAAAAAAAAALAPAPNPFPTPVFATGDASEGGARRAWDGSAAPLSSSTPPCSSVRNGLAPSSALSSDARHALPALPVASLASLPSLPSLPTSARRQDSESWELRRLPSDLWARGGAAPGRGSADAGGSSACCSLSAGNGTESWLARGRAGDPGVADDADEQEVVSRALPEGKRGVDAGGKSRPEETGAPSAARGAATLGNGLRAPLPPTIPHAANQISLQESLGVFPPFPPTGEAPLSSSSRLAAGRPPNPAPAARPPLSGAESRPGSAPPLLASSLASSAPAASRSGSISSTAPPFPSLPLPPPSSRQAPPTSQASLDCLQTPAGSATFGVGALCAEPSGQGLDEAVQRGLRGGGARGTGGAVSSPRDADEGGDRPPARPARATPVLPASPFATPSRRRRQAIAREREEEKEEEEGNAEEREKGRCGPPRGGARLRSGRGPRSELLGSALRSPERSLLSPSRRKACETDESAPLSASLPSRRRRRRLEGPPAACDEASASQAPAWTLLSAANGGGGLAAPSTSSASSSSSSGGPTLSGTASTEPSPGRSLERSPGGPLDRAGSHEASSRRAATAAAAAAAAAVATGASASASASAAAASGASCSGADRTPRTPGPARGPGPCPGMGMGRWAPELSPLLSEGAPTPGRARADFERDLELELELEDRVSMRMDGLFETRVELTGESTPGKARVSASRSRALPEEDAPLRRPRERASASGLWSLTLPGGEEGVARRPFRAGACASSSSACVSSFSARALQESVTAALLAERGPPEAAASSSLFERLVLQSGSNPLCGPEDEARRARPADLEPAEPFGLPPLGVFPPPRPVPFAAPSPPPGGGGGGIGGTRDPRRGERIESVGLLGHAPPGAFVAGAAAPGALAAGDAASGSARPPPPTLLPLAPPLALLPCSAPLPCPGASVDGAGLRAEASATTPTQPSSALGTPAATINAVCTPPSAPPSPPSRAAAAACTPAPERRRAVAGGAPRRRGARAAGDAQRASAGADSLAYGFETNDGDGSRPARAIRSRPEPSGAVRSRAAGGAGDDGSGGDAAPPADPRAPRTGAFASGSASASASPPAPLASLPAIASALCPSLPAGELAFASGSFRGAGPGLVEAEDSAGSYRLWRRDLLSPDLSDWGARGESDSELFSGSCQGSEIVLEDTRAVDAPPDDADGETTSKLRPDAAAASRSPFRAPHAAAAAAAAGTETLSPSVSVRARERSLAVLRFDGGSAVSAGGAGQGATVGPPPAGPDRSCPPGRSAQDRASSPPGGCPSHDENRTDAPVSPLPRPPLAAPEASSSGGTSARAPGGGEGARAPGAEELRTPGVRPALAAQLALEEPADGEASWACTPDAPRTALGWVAAGASDDDASPEARRARGNAAEEEALEAASGSPRAARPARRGPGGLAAPDAQAAHSPFASNLRHLEAAFGASLPGSPAPRFPAHGLPSPPARAARPLSLSLAPQSPSRSSSLPQAARSVSSGLEHTTNALSNACITPLRSASVDEDAGAAGGVAGSQRDADMVDADAVDALRSGGAIAHLGELLPALHTSTSLPTPSALSAAATFLDCTPRAPRLAADTPFAQGARWSAAGTLRAQSQGPPSGAEGEVAASALSRGRSHSTISPLGTAAVTPGFLARGENSATPEVQDDREGSSGARAPGPARARGSLGSSGFARSVLGLSGQRSSEPPASPDERPLFGGRWRRESGMRDFAEQARLASGAAEPLGGASPDAGPDHRVAPAATARRESEARSPLISRRSASSAGLRVPRSSLAWDLYASPELLGGAGSRAASPEDGAFGPGSHPPHRAFSLRRFPTLDALGALAGAQRRQSGVGAKGGDKFKDAANKENAGEELQTAPRIAKAL